MVNKQNNKDYWMFKAPIELKQKLDKVRDERVKKGGRKNDRDYNRLGLAISRYDKLIDELVDSPLPDKEDLE